MTKAYSYARWSDPTQGRGDSRRRQLEPSRAYSAEHQLDLDESFVDPGVSAYRGKNRHEGALGNFIAQIDAGTIEPGSYLLVESLDRLSRQEVLTALELFTGIIRRGIKIVALTSGFLFDRDSLNANPAMLMICIVEMMRAHEESRMKGERVAAANANKRNRAQADKTPMTALCPGWLKLVGNGRGFENKHYEVIPERAEVIRQIYLDAIAGLGKRRIANRLNRAGIPAFRGRHGWHESSVGKILSNAAVLGIFQPHRKVDGKRVPDGSPIPGYFPAIVDEVTFWRAQEAIRARQNHAAGRKGASEPNLFSGLGKCPCGAGLRYIDKGPKPKGGQYLACADAQRGLCENHAHFPYEVLEEYLFLGPALRVLAPEKPETSGNVAVARVAELEALLARRRSGQAQFIASFRESTDPVLIDEIRKVTDEVKQVEVDLVEARKAANMVEHADRRDYFERVFEARRRLDTSDINERERARATLAQECRRVIQSITLGSDRHMTVDQKASQDGSFGRLRLSPHGTLVTYTIVFVDGTTVRMDTKTFAAVFAPSGAEFTRRFNQLFRSRSGFLLDQLDPDSRLARMLNGDTRPALSQMEIASAVMPNVEREKLVARTLLRQIGPKEYEIILTKNAE